MKPAAPANARDVYAATLRLFHAIVVADDQQVAQGDRPRFSERTIQAGFVVDPRIVLDEELLVAIENTIGVNGQQGNAAFHKSWAIVQDAAIETLVIQQITHYLTTYGFQAAGIYREDTVYVPYEMLEIPQVEQDIPLAMVKAITPGTLLKQLKQMVSGVALGNQTLDDIMLIVKTQAIDASFLEWVGNRELMSRLHDHFGTAPNDPTEYLRYLVYRLTGQSLLIKNDALIEKIACTIQPPMANMAEQANDASCNNLHGFGRVDENRTNTPSFNTKKLEPLLEKAPKDLASIFYRFKPIFLALKKISTNKNFFNRLRKQAKKMHRPLQTDFLAGVTNSIREGEFDEVKLVENLRHSSIWRKIRLAYALHYRSAPADAIVYRVRNGTGWATEFKWPTQLMSVTGEAYQIVMDSIVDDLRRNVSGCVIYIPEHVSYTLPATEKMFIGNWPSGSYITAPEHLIVGIHWTNTQRSIDLDLSVLDANGKFGWDGAYRSEDRDVLFSGDMTDAPGPNGASELFYFKNAGPNPKILMVNYYNFNAADPVDCKILVAHETPESFGMNYMVDPNKIVGSATVSVSRKQNILGLVVNVDGVNRVYFSNMSVGASISASNKPHTQHARDFLFKSMIDSIELTSVLQSAGAKVVRERPTSSKYLDLSPQAIDKSTILDLLQATN